MRSPFFLASFLPSSLLDEHPTDPLLQFVYPRVNPIRKDAAVMTHQSEMVDPWEDYY